MTKMEDAIKRIKLLECPTGHIEERVVSILEDYGVATRNEISVMRNEELDSEETQGYRAQLLNSNNQVISILATSGLDDYVAKVVDVYIK